mgnify:CR=1 FL=1
MFTSRRITTMGGDKFRDEFSLAFDGTDERIACGEKFELNAFSVSAWVKTTSDASTSQVIFGNRSESAVGYICYLNANQKPTFKNMDVTITSSEILEINKWYHLVYTFNGTSDTYGMYINGKQNTLTSSTTATVSGVSPARIGIEAYNLNYDWIGNISEVAVYNADLSASQVRTLYNGREPYNHKEGVANRHLEAWYRMGDGKFDIQKHERGASYIDNSDVKSYIVSNEAATPTLSDELYTTANALADLNNANAITGLTVVEGGSTITSGTAQIDTGLSGGRYAIHIDVSAHEDRVTEDLDSICTVGKAYRLTCVAKHGGSGDGAELKLASNDALSSNPTVIESLGTSEDGWAYYGLNFIHSANTRYFGVREIGGSHNQEFWVEKLSVKEFNTGTGIMTNMSITDFEGDTP